MIGSDHGLVLRTHPLRESSKIVGVFGNEHGRLRLVANGGRGDRHRFGASLEVGNEVDVVFSLAPGRELGTVREATLRARWVAGTERLDVLATGLAVVELLDRALPEGARDPDLLRAALDALAALRASPDRAAAIATFLGFELAFLEHLGLQPAFGACSRCGGSGGSGWIDVRAGAFVCAGCRRPGSGALRLDAEVAGALRDFATGPAPSARTAEVRRAVGLVLHRLLAAHVERYRYPRALSLLKKMDRSDRSVTRAHHDTDDLGTA